jgi:hypothetical protein
LSASLGLELAMPGGTYDDEIRSVRNTAFAYDRAGNVTSETDPASILMDVAWNACDTPSSRLTSPSSDLQNVAMFDNQPIVFHLTTDAA